MMQEPTVPALPADVTKVEIEMPQAAPSGQIPAPGELLKTEYTVTVRPRRDVGMVELSFSNPPHICHMPPEIAVQVAALLHKEAAAVRAHQKQRRGK